MNELPLLERIKKATCSDAKHMAFIKKAINKNLGGEQEIMERCEIQWKTLALAKNKAALRGNGIEGLSQKQILEELYLNTRGHSWTGQSNWLGKKPLDQWHGITTDKKGDITEINLHQNNLSGTVPACIGQLSSLRVLWLHENNLEGPIPTSVGNLENLVSFDASRNNLEGKIPNAIRKMKNLHILSLAGNQFSQTEKEQSAVLGKLNQTCKYVWLS